MKFSFRYILLIALFVRLWGIWFSLPYLYHPDEPKLVRLSVKLIATSSLNPGYFFYPSFPFYIHSFLYSLFILPFTGRERLGMLYLQNPTFFYLLSRLFNGVIGALTLIPLGKIFRELGGKRIFYPLIFFTLSLLPVEISHYATVDTLLTFFVTWSLYFLLRGIREKKDNFLFYASLFTGVAGAVKYPGFILLLPLLVVLIGEKKFRLLPLLLLPFFVFLLLSPYTILDFPGFKRDLFRLLYFSRQGWAGRESPLVYLHTFTLGLGVFLFPLALWGMVREAKSFLSSVLLLFSLSYFLLVMGGRLYFSRFLLPLFPPLIIFSALAWEKLLLKVGDRSRVGWTVFLLIPTVLPTLFYLLILPSPDPRTRALVWIRENIPRGTKIALERYTPPVNVVPGYVEWRVKKGEYEVFPVIHRERLENYIRKGVEYIVISQSMFKRWGRREEGRRFYEELGKKGILVKEFPSSRLWTGLEMERPWIRIYRLKKDIS